MAEQRIEFGKRRPLPPPPATPPVKRSGHVALLVMGTLAVGGTAYALMPRQQARIARAAAAFLQARPQLAACAIRFDLIAVTPWRLPRHLQDVWRG